MLKAHSLNGRRSVTCFCRFPSLRAFAFGFVAICGAVLPHCQPIPDGLLANGPLGVSRIVVRTQQTQIESTAGNGIRFHHLSTINGLSETSVVAGVQDNLGFLWFATQFGLDRFDGYTFKTFRHEPGNKNSLACSNVRTLFKDHAGTLWVACDESLDRYDPQKETFTHFPLSRSGSSGNLVDITSIQEDNHHLLWITTHSGLFNFNPATGATHHFEHKSNDPSTLNSNNADYIAQDDAQFSWIAAGKELDRFDRNSGKVTLHVSFATPHTILGIHKDATGLTWITRTDPGCAVAQLDLSQRILKCLHLRIGNATINMHGGAYSMFEDRDGRMWFATAEDGLMELDRTSDQIVRYKNMQTDDWSLRSNSIQFVMQDRNGNMWAALHTGGIDKFSLTDPKIQTFTQKQGNLAGSLVTSLYEDHAGILWVGSFGALNRIDRMRGKNTIALGPNVKGEVFLSMIEDPQGRLLAGTYRDGIRQLDPKTGHFMHLLQPIVSPDVAKFPVTRLLFDHRGTLWAATRDGLVKIDPHTGEPLLFTPGHGPVDFSDIKEDSLGLLWLSGSSGLHSFDPATRTFQTYANAGDKPGQISDNHTNFVHIDRKGNIWVGTQNGLAELDRTTDKFTNYYQADGLPGNVIGGILEDKRGQLWLGTNHGLSRLNPETHRFTTVYVGDGITEPDLTGWSACFESTDGEMFFGGYGGAIAFLPSQFTNDTLSPPVVLTDLQVDGASVSPATGSPLSTSISYAHSVTLRHSQRVFSLEFSALSFSDPSHTRYRYMLDGINKTWHYASSSERIATYTTLPSGHYVFHAQASTNSSPWSAPGAILMIRILPPWWSTWWFRCIYIIFVLTLGWTAYRLRLDALSKALALRLEARADERTRLSRELHDTLMQTIEASRMIADYASNRQSDPVQHRLALEQLSTWLERASNQGRLAMRTLRASATSKSDLYFDLRRFIEECDRRQDIDIAFPPPPSSRLLRPLVHEEVVHIACEAIRNACAHANATRIEIQLAFNSDFSLCIRDNGKGMSQLVATHGREGHYGLRGMRERASQIGARFSLESYPGKGTVISLRVPKAAAFETAQFQQPTGKRTMWPSIRQFKRILLLKVKVVSHRTGSSESDASDRMT